MTTTMTRKSESAWIIPDDWELSEDWTDYCIHWPDSWQWRLLLKSLLYTLTRGRSWDRDSGTITDAQAIGWAIFEANHLLLDLCGDSAETDGETPTDGTIFMYIGGSLVEVSDMGQVVTSVEVVDGKLRVYYGKCCYEDLTVPAASQVIADVGDDPWKPTDDSGYEEPEYSACGKATAIVKATYLLIQAAFDALEVDWPWQILPHVEQAVGYNLKDGYLANMMANVGAGALVGLNYFDIYNVGDEADAICHLQALFGDNAAGVPTNDMFVEIRSVFGSQINALNRPMIELALQCYGRDNLDTIAKLGAIDTTSTCECYVPPFGEEVDQTGLDWFILVDLRTTAPPAGTDYDSQHDCPEGTDAYIPGVGLSACPSLYGRNQVTMDIPVLNEGGLGSSQILKAGVRWTTHAGDEYKLTPGYQVIGFENGMLGIQPGVADTTPISAGGEFDYHGATPPDEIANSSYFRVRMDYDPLAAGYEEDNPATGNVIQQFYVGGTGEAPILWPEE
jgi:hypothetical protein